MNRFSSTTTTTIAAPLLLLWLAFLLAGEHCCFAEEATAVVVAATTKTQTTAADDAECCLCNDCDMMMKAGATVYDIEEDKFVGCWDFAELIFTNVQATSDICHSIQAIYQSSCCMNAGEKDQDNNNHNNQHNNQKNGKMDKMDDTTAVADHRALQVPIIIPFSRRELWFATSTGWGGAPSSGYVGWNNANTASTPTTSWGSSNAQVVSAPANTNGMALGCSVPTYNNARWVQIYSGSSPTNVNCQTASNSGVPYGSGDIMYQVASKCLRCNCCGACTGIDANVCVGNNQPRPSGGTPGTWAARSGWRQRWLEFLDQ